MVERVVFFGISDGLETRCRIGGSCRGRGRGFLARGRAYAHVSVLLLIATT